MFKKSLRKVGAVAMALVMCFSLAAVGVSAAEANTDTSTYTVTINKEGKTETSMANDIVAGPATVTQLADDTYQIDIPIVPIYNYSAMLGLVTADGYLTSLTVTDAQASIVNTTAHETLDVPYTSATLRIVTSTEPASGTVFNVSDSYIALYKVGTDSTLTVMNHVTPSFDIVLS